VLGLRHRAVRLAPYTRAWADLYEEEARRIRQAIGEYLVALEHFGSTSVPGMPAKPILDLLGGVRRLEDAQQCAEPLAAIGYEDAGTHVIAGQHIFGRSREPLRAGAAAERTHLLHLVEYGSSHWTDNIAFRNALRAEPELAREYAALKQELAARYPAERPFYTAAKTEFVRKVLAARATRKNLEQEEFS
jgi:GrpB-like predicted nucleotidyltransferase (UPF0157 family)